MKVKKMGFSFFIFSPEKEKNNKREKRLLLVRKSPSPEQVPMINLP